jgi:prepilin-type processing-associated H-X9-DG protein
MMTENALQPMLPYFSYLKNLLAQQESKQFSGFAPYPVLNPPDSPRANVVFLDWHGIACYDEDRNFLCDLTDGKQISHSRWKTTKSIVMGHEFGT